MTCKQCGKIIDEQPVKYCPDCENAKIAKAREKLKEVFGIDDYRNIQKKVIHRIILEESDTLAIMPTGSGKSLCYQLPGLIFEGTTFVISPLIALMQDQVDKLNKLNIPAINLDSNLAKNKKREEQEIRNIQDGTYKFVYLAPERIFFYAQNRFPQINEKIKSIIKEINIPMVVIDEAHCVSVWGHDFRKEYKHIPKFVEYIANHGNHGIGTRPIVAAFTATAKKKTRLDIVKMLELKFRQYDNPFKRMSVYRENLNLKIIKINKEKEKEEYLLEYINNNPDKRGIIYCTTRSCVMEIYEMLENRGINALWYFGNPDIRWIRNGKQVDIQTEKEVNIKKFLQNDANVMVATTAFGMGIDTLIHYVIHYQMPLNIEDYYQGVGRADRDIDQAEAIYYYWKYDRNICEHLLSEGLDLPYISNDERIYKTDKLESLDIFNRYAQIEDECLHKFILNYLDDFGNNKDNDCHNCSNCN